MYRLVPSVAISKWRKEKKKVVAWKEGSMGGKGTLVAIYGPCCTSAAHRLIRFTPGICERIIQVK